MFPPAVAEAFERQYGCTETEWLRDLPGAVAPQALVLQPPSRAHVALGLGPGVGRLHLQWSKLPPLRLALLEMPRLKVGFRFEAVDAPLRQQFMKRFDLVLQRGGG
jgi:hypothetical protein